MFRQLHHFNATFDSVISLHAKLIDELKEQVPNSVNFKVGYFGGQRNAKMVIATEEDLKVMHEKYRSGEITDDERVEETSIGQKHKHDEVASTRTRYQEKEEEVDDIL